MLPNVAVAEMKSRSIDINLQNKTRCFRALQKLREVNNVYHVCLYESNHVDVLLGCVAVSWILVTFFNFIETLPKVVVLLPMQFPTKIFWLNFCFTPSQNAFPWQHDKNKKMAITSQPLMLDAFFLKMQNTRVSICSQYIISV